MDELLRLTNIKHSGQAALLSQGDELERVFSSCERAPINIEFAVEFEQTKVAGRHITDNSRHHCFAIFLRSSQLRTRIKGE